MKEKKMGNVRDWGVNKDVCGALMRVPRTKVRQSGTSVKGEGGWVGANRAPVTACGRKGAWPCV